MSRVAGVHGAQPRLRSRALREVSRGIHRRRPGNARAVRALVAAPEDRAPTPVAAAVVGVPLEKVGRRGQPGGVDPPLRPSGRAARSARLRKPLGDPSLLPETHGLTDDDLQRAAGQPRVRRRCDERRHDAFDAIEALRRIYCSTTGYDYAHVFVPEEREWLRQAAEAGRFRAPADPIDPRGAARPADAGRGVRAVPAPHVPRQDALLDRGARHAGADARRDDRRRGRGRASRHILIGMAHRGRLNVMAHVLDKPYAQILAEFKDPIVASNFRERHGVDRRREVSRRRAARDQGRPRGSIS